MRASRPRAAAWTLALALAAGCTPSAPPARMRPPNVLLIVIDTLRADRLGAYGAERRLTPFLDELAERSTVFRHAYAQCSWTEPSIASIFTSRYPSQHGATAWHSSIGADNRMVAEVFHAHGYDTAGWSANMLIEPSHGFTRGFAFWAVGDTTPIPDQPGVQLEMRADDLSRATDDWLERRAETVGNSVPTFLYLQYMEPHYPFAPPPAILARVAQGRAVDVAHVNARYYFDPRGIPLQELEDVYDASVASLDEDLRDLFDSLARLHFLDDTVVVVTADHGEEFDDHGGRSHGKTLYNELIRVPLLIHVPGQRARRDVTDVVSLIDVAPTILDLCGIPAPRGFTGRSIRSLTADAGIGDRIRAALRRRPDEPRAAFSELLPKTKNDVVRHDRALIRGSLKLLVSPSGEAEGFDLAADPGETAPLPADGPARNLEEPLGELVERIRANPPSPPVYLEQIDEKTRERLKALGYAG